jgi:hypothetical protein
MATQVDVKDHWLVLTEGFTAPTEASQLTIEKIGVTPASELNAMWHKVLPKIHVSNIVHNKHYICFGAHYGGMWLAVGIWSSPVNQAYDGLFFMELRRFALSPQCPPDTAVFMLKEMQRRIHLLFPDIHTLISYQGIDVDESPLYEAAAWYKAATTVYRSWSVTRDRAAPKSIVPKIRWEYKL